MQKIYSPDLEGFKPVKDYEALGQPLTVLRGPDNLALTLSQDGKNKVAYEPGFAHELLQLADFIVRHGGLQPAEVVNKSTLPIELVRPACIAPSYNKYHTSSLYKSGGLMFKAFDLDKRRKVEGKVQFETMNALRGAIDQSPHDPGLTSPRQYAKFKSSRSGHETIVMDRLPGKTLGWALRPLGSTRSMEETIALKDEVLETIALRLDDVVGRSWPKSLNDVTQRHTGNILVDDTTVELNHDTIEQTTFGLIDQPATGIRIATRRLFLHPDGL